MSTSVHSLLPITTELETLPQPHFLNIHACRIPISGAVKIYILLEYAPQSQEIILHRIVI